MVTVSRETVETAKKHYKITSFQQAYFQSATKSILNRLGIDPIAQAYYFAFNDQIFSLTSKFGNGLIGKQTVSKTAYVFCANYVAMLGSRFDLTICNKILQLYNISAYIPIPIHKDYYINPLLNLALLESISVQNIDLGIDILIGFQQLLINPYLDSTMPFNVNTQDLAPNLFISLEAMQILTLYLANQAEPRLVETETSTVASLDVSVSGNRTVYIYFKVYKVSGIVETELTSGWISAGSRSTNGESEKDTDWICPATTFLSGDKIRVYVKLVIGAGTVQESWDSVATYSGLSAQTWTFHFWLFRLYFGGYTYGSFEYGILSVYPSRITSVGVTV